MPWPVPMYEPLVPARCGEHLAGGQIYLLGGHSGGDGGRAPALGDLQRRVGLCEAVARFTDVERTRRVGAVTPEFAAEIDHDAVAFRHHSVARLVMGRGRVGAGGDDGKGGFVVAGIDRHLHDPARQRRLRGAAEDGVAQPTDDLICGRGRTAQ